MVFSSIPFLFYFLPICLMLYYIVPFSFKNGVLLFFSLVFYAWGEPVYILLLIFETLSDFIIGLCMEKYGNTKAKKKGFLCCSLIIDLSLLFFFKYADFTVNTANSIFHSSIKNPNIALPLGISFFTFQTLSYVVDLYRGDVKTEHNYFHYLTYVSMFPQLIAGPIVRYSTIADELKSRKINWSEIYQGMLIFLYGLFKKVLIANAIGLLWEQVRSTEFTSISVACAWLGALAATLQLYFDFSGYSDMAIGIGRMLGFHFNPNFNYPLSSLSITDFWRRWHMSLSYWFRDYVYIPLGGNRKGTFKHIRNIMIVWFLTGLWHGAAWNFVLWGVYYGVILLLEKFFLMKYIEKLPKFIRHLYAILIVVFGFVIFSFDDFGILTQYIAVLFGAHGNPLFGADFLWYFGNYGFIVIVALVISFPVFPWLKSKVSKPGSAAATVVNVLFGISIIGLYALCIASIVNDSYNPFLYFRF